MSSSAKQTAPHEVPPGVRLVLYACLPASLGKAADHSVASTRRYVADAGWETVDDARRPGSTTNRSDHPDRSGTAMTATTLSPITTATTEACCDGRSRGARRPIRHRPDHRHGDRLRPAPQGMWHR
jgi:hypothetical protein